MIDWSKLSIEVQEFPRLQVTELRVRLTERKTILIDHIERFVSDEVVKKDAAFRAAVLIHNDLYGEIVEGFRSLAVGLKREAARPSVSSETAGMIEILIAKFSTIIEETRPKEIDRVKVKTIEPEEKKRN